jgi:hypothetical protein
MPDRPSSDAVASQINQVGSLSSEMSGSIDALFGSPDPAPKPADSTPPPDAQPKPADQTPKASDNAPKTSEPAPKQTEPANKPADQTSVPKGPRELRAAYDALKAERDQLAAKSADDLKAAKEEAARIKAEFEHAKANGASRDELEALRKEATEASNQLKLVKYEASKEFKEQYDKPWNESRDSLLKNLTTREWKDPSGGRFTPSASDVWKLLQMDDVSASEYIHDTFSASVTGLVSQWRDKAITAYNARSKALEDWHGKHKEWEQQQARDQEANSAKIKTWIGDEETSLSTKEPDFYKRPDDSVLASKYDDAAKDVEIAFNRHPTDNTQNASQRLEQVIRAQGRMSSRAKAFPVLTEKLKSANARIAELESKLNGYKKSEPNPGPGNSRGAKPAKANAPDIYSGFDEWLKTNK